MKDRFLQFLTTFIQLTARLKNFLMDWLLVKTKPSSRPKGLEEGLEECVTLCIKSWVILYIHYSTECQQKWPYSEPTHQVLFLTWCRDGPIAQFIILRLYTFLICHDLLSTKLSKQFSYSLLFTIKTAFIFLELKYCHFC